MARPQKTGLDYFSLDVDFFSDKKIKILKARYGADGITLYLYLLCEIYKSGYYLKMDDDFEFIASDDLNMNSDKVKQVLTFLLERSMFDKQLFQSDAVLTSTGIQKRFQLMVKSRASKNPITVKRFWLLNIEETETFIKVNPNINKSENQSGYSEKNSLESEINDIKESKEKESKLYIDAAQPGRYFENEELNKTFLLYLAKRKSSGRVYMKEEVDVLRKELLDIADNDEGRIAVARKAFTGDWKSFYPVKQKQESKPKKKAKADNKFNNFHQREYDYEKLEKEILTRQMEK